MPLLVSCFPVFDAAVVMILIPDFRRMLLSLISARFCCFVKLITKNCFRQLTVGIAKISISHASNVITVKPRNAGVQERRDTVWSRGIVFPITRQVTHSLVTSFIPSLILMRSWADLSHISTQLHRYSLPFAIALHVWRILNWKLKNEKNW